MVSEIAKLFNMVNSWYTVYMSLLRCFFVKKCQKKCAKNLQVKKKSLPLQPLWTKDRKAIAKQRSEKVLKKVPKIFGGLKNLPYLCIRFRLKTKAVLWKKSLKNLAKRFGDYKKKVLPLHHFPPSKNGGRDRGVARPPKQTETVLIAIYERRSLKYLSS